MSHAHSLQGRSVDPRRFPHHTEVQEYLKAFVEHYNIRPFITFSTRVSRIRPRTACDTGVVDCPIQWEVVTAPAVEGGAGASERSGVYDAVVVANGHFSVPRIAHLDGMETYPAKFEHSHNYRRPEVYSGKRVLLVGAYTSGAVPTPVWLIACLVV